MAGLGAGVISRGGWEARLEASLARREFSSAAFVTDTPVVADFVELGLLALRRLRSEAATWQAHALSGAQLGFRLRARRRFRDVDQDVTDELREADVKALVGLRAARRGARGELFMDLRWLFGLTNLDATNQQQIRARSWVLLLGYST